MDLSSHLEKLKIILLTAENATNNDLFTASKMLSEEFEKTKELIIDLTRQLDNIADMYEKVNNEYKKRSGKK